MKGKKNSKKLRIMQIVGLSTKKKLPKNKCILWDGAVKQGGYGRLKYEDKIVSAHRLSYCMRAKIPLSSIDGLVVRHKCDTPRCINPEHLEIGTTKDNQQDAVKRGRHKNPVMIGSCHGRTRMTESDVIRIREALKNDSHRDRQQEFADEFGVSLSTINAIYYRRNWKHI